MVSIEFCINFLSISESGRLTLGRSANGPVFTPSKGVGASLSISRTKVTILSADSTSIKAKWETIDNDPLTGAFNLYTDSGNIITTVQWHFIQKVKWYPWEKFASIVSNKAIGPFMEKSLDNLKRQAENNQ